MRKIRIIFLLCLTLPLLSGCDLFRKLAGRPTSEQIEQKRAMIERELQAHQGRLDSLDAVQQQLSDSLALLDSIRLSDDTLVEVRQIAEQSRSTLEYRYYVIVGAFGNRENAVRFAGEIGEKGYSAELISYVNGFTAVGICPSDRLAEVYASLREVRDGGICPDAWILDNQ